MERGSVRIGIIAALSTLLVVGVIISVTLHQFRVRQEEYHRIATRICESGLQTALMKLGEQPAWSSGFDRVPCEGGWYAVKITAFMRADSQFVALQADGHFKSASETKSCLLASDPSGRNGVPWRLAAGICSGPITTSRN